MSTVTLFPAKRDIDATFPGTFDQIRLELGFAVVILTVTSEYRSKLLSANRLRGSKTKFAWS